MTNSIPISIAICTYNRAEQLRLTLDSILSIADTFQEGDELIVVDNNSNDNTRSLIAEYQTKIPLKYAFEPVQGLSAARNTALKMFNNDWLLFTDDDVTVTKDYLAGYRTAIAESKDYDFYGGKIEVDWQGRRPKWLISDDMPLISGLILYYNQTEDADEYKLNSLLPYGANFAFSRKLAERVGKFNTSFGPLGKNVRRGDDTDFILRALELGFRGRFLSDPLVLHRFNPKRLTTYYTFKYGVQKGRMHAVMNGQGRSTKYLTAASFLCRALLQLLKGRVDRYYQCIINVGIAVGK